jgi:hypothetical protein
LWCIEEIWEAFRELQLIEAKFRRGILSDIIKDSIQREPTGAQKHTEKPKTKTKKPKKLNPSQKNLAIVLL